jgi:hypothetical protein
LKEILIYVEGPSDQLGLRRLLGEVIDSASDMGNKVDFYPMGGKEPLLNKGPIKALNILRNKPKSWVFLVPDLYPPNKPFPHSNYDELKSELEKKFITELKKRGCEERLRDRFFVHCFKYDLEVLLLASEKNLMERLEVTKFSRKWVKPVEDQNHQRPPKRIVEALFQDCGKKYKDTIDAPWILEHSDYNHLRDICYQNFKPFLNDLLKLIHPQ